MGKKAIVLGAGLSGLSTAWHLVKNGFEVDIIEALPFVGGLAATTKINDYYFDFGPHPFYTQHDDILQVVEELIGNDLIGFQRDCKLYFDNQHLHYPPSVVDIVTQMGTKTAWLSFLSFAKTRFNNCLKTYDGSNFEEWCIRNFGRYFYDIFFKPYTEQFWKIPPKKLADDWADARVSKMNFLKTIQFLFTYKNTYKKKKRNISQIERDTLPLYYPVYGIGMIADQMAGRIRNYGGRIHNNTRAQSLTIRSNGLIEVVAGRNNGPMILTGDVVVSSIPVRNLVKIIQPPPPVEVQNHARQLNSMGLIVLYLIVDKLDVMDTSYFYFFDRPYHRITELNKFSTKLSPPDKNMLSLEISCYENDDTWRANKEDLYKICVKHLERDGFIGKENVKEIFMFKAAHVYPVYLVDYRSHLEVIFNYISKLKGLEVIGRQGQFNYMDMDQAIKYGFEKAEQILRRYS